MRTRHTRRGQALVEFALVLPILVLLLLGIFDLGRAVYAFSTVNNAAREGARLAIVDQTTAHVQAHAAQRASSLSVADTDVALSFQSTATPGTACPHAPGSVRIVECTAVVVVPYDFTAITPIVGNLVGSIRMEGEARFPVSHPCLDPTPDPPVDCPEGS